VINVFNVEKIVTGKFKQNCYILSCDSRDCLVIDPGADAVRILDHIQANKLVPLAILNTHAHFDHVGAIAELKEKFEIPCYFHPGDLGILKKATFFAHFIDGVEPIEVPSVDFLFESDKLELGPFSMKIMHTPGHSQGSVCIRLGGLIFTGDTVFSHANGRVDLPGGDIKKLRESLKLISRLPQDIVMYPGHGGHFTLKQCIEGNEAFRELTQCESR
jgi:hydroxyacylglutathione hydrolase